MPPSVININFSSGESLSPFSYFYIKMMFCTEYAPLNAVHRIWAEEWEVLLFRTRRRCGPVFAPKGLSTSGDFPWPSLLTWLSRTPVECEARRMKKYGHRKLFKRAKVLPHLLGRKDRPDAPQTALKTCLRWALQPSQPPGREQWWPTTSGRCQTGSWWRRQDLARRAECRRLRCQPPLWRRLRRWPVLARLGCCGGLQKVKDF